MEHYTHNKTKEGAKMDVKPSEMEVNFYLVCFILALIAMPFLLVAELPWAVNLAGLIATVCAIVFLCKANKHNKVLEKIEEESTNRIVERVVKKLKRESTP